jgi:hypothetical protein
VIGDGVKVMRIATGEKTEDLPIRPSPRQQNVEVVAANCNAECGFGGVAAAGTGGEYAMTIEVFDSVWDALEDTPTEAENIKLHLSLMIAICEAVSGWHVTQADAAKRLGVT